MFRHGIQWFQAPDDGAASATPVDQTAPAPKDSATPAAAENTDKGPVPYERFTAVNEKYRAAEAKIAAFEKSQADSKKGADAAEKARLVEQGKYQELAEAAEKRANDLEPHKAKAERYEASLTKLLAKEREGLPKHITALLDKLDPADQLDYIAENRETLTAKPAAPPPNINGTAGAGVKPAVDQDAYNKELIARYRI